MSSCLSVVGEKRCFGRYQSLGQVHRCPGVTGGHGYNAGRRKLRNTTTVSNLKPNSLPNQGWIQAEDEGMRASVCSRPTDFSRIFGMFMCKIASITVIYAGVLSFSVGGGSLAKARNRSSAGVITLLVHSTC